MATYYKIACDKKKEHINPGYINNLGIKKYAIADLEHPLGAIAIFAMLNRWEFSEVRLVSDANFDEAYYCYTDVTEEVLSEYNKYYDTQIHYTPGKK